MKIKISCLKLENDKKSFKMLELLGADVYQVKNVDNVDNEIKSIINKQYSTIVLSSDVAGLSQDVITKYSKTPNINIIIAKGREEV